MDKRHRRPPGGIPLAFGAVLAGLLITAAGFVITGPAWLRGLVILPGLALVAAGGWAFFLHQRWNRAASPSLPGELAENEERLRLALEGAGLAIWDRDIASGEQTVSPEWSGMLGYAPGELDGSFQGWQRLVHPDDLPGVLAAIDAHLEDRLPVFEAEYRLKTRGGDWKWVLARGRVVSRGPDGRPLRMAGTHRDIHAHKQMDEVLSRRDAILNAVSITAEHLLSSETWTEVLPEMLSRLGQAVQASRAYVFEVFEQQPGEMASRQVREWTAPGIRPEATPGVPLIIPIRQSGFIRWQEILSAGQILQGNVASFPACEQPYLDALGIRSLITVPIHTGSSWWGFMGFDDCQTERAWLPVETDVLKVAANVLAAAIQRHLMFEAEREERRAAEELREIAVVFSQSLNYDSILDRLLEQAPRLVPFDNACVMLVRGGQAYIARQRSDQRQEAEAAQWVTVRSFEIAQTPNLRHLVETRQPMIIADTNSYPGWVPVEGYGFRAWAGVPLILEGQVDAILSLAKLEPGFYTPVHAARLSLFSGQASLALRNAQLFAETLETLEHEQHLGDITRAISSELDLPVILQHVVRLAVELAEAEAGSMAILDDETQTLRYPYLYNLPQELSLEVETPGTGIAWETIYQRQSQMLDEYSSHPLANPHWVAAGIHGLIGVPVIAGNTCLGGLSVFTYDPEHHFNARDLSLVELVGHQAGVAIQNARLFESAQHRAAEAETLRQAASAVNSALALNEVLDKILEQLETVIPYDSAAIFLVEEDHISMKAGRGLADLAELMARQYPLEDRLFMAVEASGQPVVLEDAQTDPRFERWGNYSEIHGWIGLALRVREEKIGYLTIDSHQLGAYHISDGELAQAFADEVAIAIENARLFEQVQRLAITDPLTGLYNRRYFFEAAHREFERARRYNSPLSVIMIDLDHFKDINDTYGHLAGDRVLVAVATRSRQSLREVDVLARYGGEEFIYLLPQTGLEGACLLAERLRACIMDQPVDSGSQHISVTASIGLAEVKADCPDLQALIHRADQALYATKHTIRGTITVWQDELDNT
jgi:diguanylate cyclase (GGDEF)-like protein/PAS domain S-box-containing protein